MKELERKILSIIIARLDGDRISEKSYAQYIERLVKDGIGGFVLFGGDYEEVKKFLAHLQNIASEYLIIASDIERGVGQQIKGRTLIPSQMGIRAGFDLIKDKTELEMIYSIVVKEAKDTGINLALIPVLDVNTEPGNPIICTRAFSDDPEIVSEYGRFIIKFFESRGLATCGKHFPGHGSTQSDSHIWLPTLRNDIKIHLKPFKEAIKERISAIMVGHLVAFDIDIKPATLSEKAIRLLRQELGFKGVVLTDAMNMKALMDYENPHILALNAGVDIILHPDEPYKAMEEIKKAYQDGLIRDGRINEALRRIKRLKKRLISFIPTETVSKEDLSEESLLIRKAFKKTVTVIKNEIADLKSHQIIPYLTGVYTEEIKNAFKDYFGSAYDLIEYKPSDALPMIAAFTDIKAGGKDHTLAGQQNIKIKEVILNKNAIFISFGNPYIIRFSFFLKAKAIFLVYDCHKSAVLAFLEAFNEGLKDSGRVPVKIEMDDE